MDRQETGVPMIRQARTGTDPLDFYETPHGTAWHGAMLALRLAPPISRVLDAGCGMGVLGRALENLDRESPNLFVRYCDIQDRGFGNAVICDVKDVASDSEALVFTNPPYNQWREFVRECQRIAPVVVALGPVTLLDTVKEMPPGLSEVHITARPKFKGQPSQAATPHAWFVFRRDETAHPTLRLLDAPMRLEIRRRDKMSC